MTPYYSPTVNPYYGQPLNPYIGQQQLVQSPMISNGPIMAWIQGGIDGAKQFPLSPNSRGYLFDSEKESFYVKVLDAYGRVESIRQFDYHEVPIEEEKQVNNSVEEDKYITKEDFNKAMEDLKSCFRKGGHNNGKQTLRGTNESRNDGSVQ